jgi:hypothetical protein
VYSDSRCELLIGLNSTLHVNYRSNDITSHEDVARRICNLNISYFRIPLVWSQLQSYRNGEPSWNDEAVGQLGQTLSYLPQRAQVLGLLTSPPPYVAVQYLHDQRTLERFFCRFVEECINRFPRINDWEVWNEPNASDFYLSVQQEGIGHRPWTAKEFLYHAAIPGARTIRRLAPRAKICLSGVAEDGIVGHPEKKACLSNRLPNRQPFASMRSDDPHGQFYFIPGFLLDLISELKAFWDATLGDKLFDAIAFHPYPYHGIYKTMDMDLVARSISLVDSFVAVASTLSPHDPEIWITEVGCRSLDVPARNLWNEDRQCEFALKFFGSQPVRASIARVYWYKAVDATWDLIQEKTFGLLDHYGNPKKAYYALQKLAVEECGSALSFLLDDFRYGLKYAQYAVNENLFELETKTVFGFAIPSIDHFGAPDLLVSPGREQGDWIRITGKHPIRIPNGSKLEIGMEFSKVFPGIPGLELELELYDTDSSSRRVGISLGTANDDRLLVTPTAISESKPGSPIDIAAADVASVFVRFSPFGCEVSIRGRSACQSVTLPTECMPVADRVTTRWRFIKRSAKREMVRLARISARVVEETPEVRLPRDMVASSH